MSRIGRKKITLPDGVEFSIDNEKAVQIKGAKGKLFHSIPDGIDIEKEDNIITVTRVDDTKRNRALHGLTRALLNNMVLGVSEGFTKEMSLFGVGYKMEIVKNYLVMNLGFSHPIYFKIPESITLEVTKPVNNLSTLKVSGNNKELVGLISDKIRSLKKPEPYKGKGFKYKDEIIIRKAGKTAK